MGQLFFAVLVYDRSSSQFGSRIHAHVEGTVSHKAETAFRIFELPGRDTKIKKRPADGANPKLIQNAGRVSEIRLPHGDAAAETRQLLACMLDRIRILI